jgi:ADP-ribose pyrophosphatase YjhB (NUDIX family)
MSTHVRALRARRKPTWAAPGSAVEPEEPPCDAVVREETGLVVEPVALRELSLARRARALLPQLAADRLVTHLAWPRA